MYSPVINEKTPTFFDDITFPLHKQGGCIIALRHNYFVLVDFRLIYYDIRMTISIVIPVDNEVAMLAYAKKWKIYEVPI